MRKSIIRYLTIFAVVSIIAFIATVIFTNIDNLKISRTGKSQLAFVDLESGEVIPIPEFENKETGLPEPVCLRNSNGQIIFWGEYDYNTDTMSGDILSVEAILNQSSGKEYYLTTNTHIIQIGNYYISFNRNNIETSKGEESRCYLSIHYCGNH